MADLRCRLGFHAFEPIVRMDEYERQNCQRPGCGVGRLLARGVELERGRDWWFPTDWPPRPRRTDA